MKVAIYGFSLVELLT